MEFEKKYDAVSAPKVESAREKSESPESETTGFEQKSAKISDYMKQLENARHSHDHLSQLSATKYLEEVVPDIKNEADSYLKKITEELGGLPEVVSMEGPVHTV